MMSGRADGLLAYNKQQHYTITIKARSPSQRASLGSLIYHDNVPLLLMSDSVCPHDKTKIAETKLGTEIVHHNTSPTSEY